MIANKQEWCGVAGWTTRQFDTAVINGFPARKRTSSRGDTWQVDTRDGIQWMVEQEAPKHRPAVRSGPPPGWKAFKAAEAVDDVVDAVSLVNLLALLYCLPRLAALVAAELGLGLDQVFRLSGALLRASEELCRQQFAFWPEERDDAFLQGAFQPVNWPWLADRAGEPDWTPPGYALGWIRLTEEQHAASVRKGEEAARWADEEKGPAATADA